MTTTNEEIAALAYSIWEQEGSPEGRDVEHWLQAELHIRGRGTTQAPPPSIQQHALKVFRQPPERFNCAQSVLHAWREVFGDTAIPVAELKPFGAGRAPDGLCGAVYAACLLAPDRADELKAAFAARVGSLRCKEIRAAKQHPCTECVAYAAELLAGKESPLPDERFASSSDCCDDTNQRNIE
jgi:hypothetical protein